MKLRKILSALLAGLMLATVVIITPAVANDEPLVIVYDYNELFRDITNAYKTATVEKNVIFEGKNALKVTPNPNTDHETTLAKGSAISLDAYGTFKNVDLTRVRYATVEYYLDMPEVAGQMTVTLVNNPSGTLTSGLTVSAKDPMVTGKWATATFDLTALEQRANPDKPNLYHMQLRPYSQSVKYTTLKETDVCYIGRVIFYSELPNNEDHESYMKGYTDGTFLPGNTMTRAEACTTVARIAAGSDELVPADKTSSFTDVASHWGNKYIAYVESLGYLKSYTGAFLPDQPITRAEFVELVYNMGLLKDAGKPSAFTDVDATHPRYTVITASAKAGLVNGYDNGDGTFSFKPDNTITRAEVVTVINRARSRDTKSDNIPANISKIFLDVDRTHWAFGNIAEATINHESSNGKWIMAKEDPLKNMIDVLGEETVYGYSESYAKIAELDALEAQRIAEIRATPSDYSRITGKKIYVSSSMGDDANDGLSEATPVKSIAKANEIAVYGDGVLLKRGDMWRESVYAESGLTYSAYGEGSKPFINASPENGADPDKWTLVYEDKETGALIWKYHREDFLDTGVIVLNDGEGGYFGEKVARNFNGKHFYDKNDPEQKPYTYKQLGNMQFFHKIDSSYTGNNINCDIATGPLFFRCDYGNPGSVFDSIEFATRVNCVKVQTGVNDVFFDNLCLKYSGFYGISLSTDVKNITVKNCEIGWIGGTITRYHGWGRGEEPTRLGNGIEIYGAVDGFYIDNNYVYQCYDAGLTHQVSNQDKNCRQDNVYYTNNVVTDCVYSIEYFLTTNKDNAYYDGREGENILFEGNLLRRAGWGFGSSRPDINNQRHIRSGASATSSKHAYYNFEIRNNIFDRAVHELVETYTYVPEAAAKYSGNTFIQGVGNGLYTHSKDFKNTTDPNALVNIQRELGDATAQVYFVPNIPKWEFKFPQVQSVPVSDEDRAKYEAYLANPPKNDTETLRPFVDMSPVEGEGTEVKEPMLVFAMGDSAYKYGYMHPSMNLEKKYDETTGMTYAHFTFNNTSDKILLDTYKIPKIDLTGGQVYFKFLVRTNNQDPRALNVNFCRVWDSNGIVLGSHTNPNAQEPKATGEWEEVLIKASDFKDNYNYSTHIYIWMLGTSRTGENLFNTNGTLKQDDLYFDIAAWGVFPNLASAQAYDLSANAK